MSFWGKIKVKLARKKLKFRRRISKPYIPNEREQEAIHIIKTLIKDETSVMMVAPISKKRYIRNERRKMFVIMEDVHLTLTSSKSMYYYDLVVCQTVSDILNKNFDNVLEIRRARMEKDMIQGVTSNLSFIAKHMGDAEKDK
jgi:hypothetical protein